MMKRLAFIMLCLLLSTSYGWAQSGMTDNQVMDYVIEQNAKGVSRQQIVTQLMQRGVTLDQIKRLQKKYQRQMKNGALGAEDITAGSKEVKARMREANGDKRPEQADREKRNVSKYRTKDGRQKTKKNTYDEEDKDFMEMDDAMDFMMPDSLKYFMEEEKEKGRKIFGHDVFNNKNMTFESSMNLATPQNYHLGRRHLGSLAGERHRDHLARWHHHHRRHRRGAAWRSDRESGQEPLAPGHWSPLPGFEDRADGRTDAHHHRQRDGRGEDARHLHPIGLRHRL